MREKSAVLPVVGSRYFTLIIHIDRFVVNAVKQVIWALGRTTNMPFQAQQLRRQYKAMRVL